MKALILIMLVALPSAAGVPVDAAKKAIVKGTMWLDLAFNPDGGVGTDIDQPSDVGCTSIVGLALLSQGSTLKQGPHKNRLRRLRAFLLRHVAAMKKSGDIERQTGTQLHNDLGPLAHTALALLFLSQSTGAEPVFDAKDFSSNRSGPAVRKLARVLWKNRQKDGSWSDNCYYPVMATTVAWLSLRGAASIGVRIPISSSKTVKWIREEGMRKLASGYEDNGTYDYDEDYEEEEEEKELFSGDWGPQELVTGASIARVLHSARLGSSQEMALMLDGAFSTEAMGNSLFAQAGGEHFLAMFMISEILSQKGGTAWKGWNDMVRAGVISVQNKDGSWTGYQCITARTFTTAAALLILQAQYRYLPMSDI